MQGRVLVVAGSDSGGGAGIQADIKTITALGGYAMTAITALTAQDTRSVHAVVAVPASFVALQMRVVLDDLGADAIKLGMLFDAAIVGAVADTLPVGLPVVLDPVMIAKGGASLLADDAVATMVERLLPRATLVTPNIPEAERLTGRTIADVAAMADAARFLSAQSGAAVLVKGGHLDGATVTDLLVRDGIVEAWTRPRLATRHTHGTGCTLASAIAIGLAQKMDLVAAIGRARDYVQRAIEQAPGYGGGNGPLDHAHSIPPFGR